MIRPHIVSSSGPLPFPAETAPMVQAWRCGLAAGPVRGLPCPLSCSARRAGREMTKLEGTMAEISISACRTALQWAWCRRQAGIPLKLQGRQVVIDRPVEARGKNWVCGDLVLGRAEKVALTKEARRIIAEKVTPQPPWAFPPEISSQECLKAIEHAGGVTIRHRGEELHITELVTRGTHWWSGDRRLTPGAKRRLTNAAREILKFRHSWRAAAM